MAKVRQRKTTKTTTNGDKNKNNEFPQKNPTTTNKRRSSSNHRQKEFPVVPMLLLLAVVGFVVGTNFYKYGKFMFVDRSSYDLRYNATEWQHILKDKTVLLIGGPHRGGTTILWECIAKHPEISGFGSTFDTGADFSEGILLQDVYPTFGIGRTHNQRRDQGLGRYALPKHGVHLTEFDKRISVPNKIKLLNRFGQYWNLSLPVLVEKSPPTAIMSRFLQALYNVDSPVKTKFLFITRHPIANAYAHQNMERSLTMYELMKNYLNIHTYLMRDLPKLRNDPMLLTLEEFAESPSRYLKQIFEWLKVDSTDETVQSILETIPIRSDVNEKYKKMWCGQKKAIPLLYVQQWHEAIKAIPLPYDILNWCGDAVA
jgi:hypothetical protein